MGWWSYSWGKCRCVKIKKNKKKKKKKKKKNKQTLTDNHFIVKKQQCRIKTYNNRCYFHYHELICLASLHFNLFAYLFIKIEGNFV